MVQKVYKQCLLVVLFVLSHQCAIDGGCASQDVLCSAESTSVYYYIQSPHQPRFTTVGTGGVIHSSEDGINWSANTNTNTQSLYTAIIKNGHFVAQGVSGSTLVSQDGYQWSQVPSITADFFTDSIYWQNSIVAITASASNANIYRSFDFGKNWTNVGILAISPGNLARKIAANQDTLFVTDNGGSTLYQSNDATTWTNSPVPGSGGAIPECIYVKGNLILIGDDTGPATIWYSADAGVNWTIKTITGALSQGYGFTYGNGKILFSSGAGGGSTAFHTSTDQGKTWTLATTLSADLTTLTFGNGRFVATGLGGMVSSSEDGINWTTPKSLGIQTFNNIAFGYMFDGFVDYEGW